MKKITRKRFKELKSLFKGVNSEIREVAMAYLEGGIRDCARILLDYREKHAPSYDTDERSNDVCVVHRYIAGSGMINKIAPAWELNKFEAACLRDERDFYGLLNDTHSSDD